MTIVRSNPSALHPTVEWYAVLPPRTARLLLVVAMILAAAAGFLLADSDSAASAVSNAGEDLTRLLRLMAALKALLALGAVAAVFWRLGSGATPTWLLAYALACGAMSAGPGLIWTMAHVGMGAVLLHGGLAAVVILSWRDPVVADRLAAIVTARRKLR